MDRKALYPNNVSPETCSATDLLMLSNSGVSPSTILDLQLRKLRILLHLSSNLRRDRTTTRIANMQDSNPGVLLRAIVVAV